MGKTWKGHFEQDRPCCLQMVTSMFESIQIGSDEFELKSKVTWSDSALNWMQAKLTPFNPYGLSQAHRPTTDKGNMRLFIDAPGIELGHSIDCYRPFNIVF